MGLRLFGKKRQDDPPPEPVEETVIDEAPVVDFEPASPIQLRGDQLQQAVQQGRLGHILQNRVDYAHCHDLERVCLKVCEKIDDVFAMVPEGFVTLPQVLNDEPGCPEETHETVPFLIAKCCVTNAQYQHFVDAGGYQNLDLWPKDMWPHLIDFVDQTREPGPRFWRNGRHDRRLSEHPVVGINFYEATAYAAWLGFRLPTEPEWQMAATWRLRSVANTLRRYPWGDALDIRRCNIWASGHGTTVPVHGYLEGAAPNQALQLIGNVWEWTSDPFAVSDNEGNQIVSDMHMTSIRGGAFDTYFPAQATGTFRTGLVSMARTHNTGIRLAAGMNLING